MAQPEEPLYDFPEPAPGAEHQWAGHQRGQGSLRNISVLDRLLLTLPVWLQLSINPATALHILQREPPGTFLVRKSRTSQRSVLCVRLADDSVPSFVQQFGIREEHGTVCLETSDINFSDLPRLIAFYCVSRDVLPFNLELPEAIAKATSHKELESISHMGVEFWSSQLNFRGPREARKAQKFEEKNPEPIGAPPSDASSQANSATQPGCPPKLDPTSEHEERPQTNAAADQSTLFQEFCPIRTRSPRELNCGSDMVTLCFVNPLFPPSHDALQRRHVFKRSHKIRVSTENSSPLSPPLDPPPPPPLMAKSKGRCKARQQAVPKTPCGTQAQPSQPAQRDPRCVGAQLQTSAQRQPVPQPSPFLPQIQEQDQKTGQIHVEPEGGQEARPPTPTTTTEHLPDPDESDYRQPSTKVFNLTPSLSPHPSPSISPRESPSSLLRISPSLSPHPSPSISPRESPSSLLRISPSLSPHPSPSISPRESPSSLLRISPSLSPHPSPSISPRESPSSLLRISPSLSPHPSPSISPRESPSSLLRISPSLSPHPSPSISPRESPSSLLRISPSLSQYDSPGVLPSLSPYQSPCPSPKAPLPLCPFPSPSASPVVEDYCTPATSPRPRQRGKEGAVHAVVEEIQKDDNETDEQRDGGEGEIGFILTHLFPIQLNDPCSCSSLSSLEEAALTCSPSILQVDNGIATGLQ